MLIHCLTEQCLERQCPKKRIRARASLFIARSLFRMDNWQDLCHETHIIKNSPQSAGGVRVPVSRRHIPDEWHQRPPTSDRPRLGCSHVSSGSVLHSSGQHSHVFLS